ncbi:MAG: M20/M25/M40 family metallo-hydrolase [Deltaproteobacteria bacterium]|nr:MAG: M20/M25/M40 family metallo-hydrolase [Deltaproteobacteria bacterium]
MGLRPILATSLLLAVGACDRGAHGETCPPEPPAVPKAGASTAPSDAPVTRIGRRRDVADTMARVDPARIRRRVDRLAAFGTRHTLSRTDSPDRGIGAARSHLVEVMQAAADASQRTDLRVVPLSVRLAPDGRRIDTEAELVDVMGVIPGVRPDRAREAVVLLGHYDSRASDVMDRETDAPGADDNASGTAVVVEAFTALAQGRFDRSIYCVATAGEEQGLLGARALAEHLDREGIEVVAVLDFDIVGDPTLAEGGRRDDAVRMFVPYDPALRTRKAVERAMALGTFHDGPSAHLARHVAEIARAYGTLRPHPILRADRFLRGGDHLPFAEAGRPALRFSEFGETYTRQHQDVRTEGGVHYGDLPEFVDAAYVADVARLAVAVAAHVADAPRPPTGVRFANEGLATDTTLVFEPSPDAVAHEVLVRPTHVFSWQEAFEADASGRVVVPRRIDDAVFAVRAVDAKGRRSLAVTPVLPAR